MILFKDEKYRIDTNDDFETAIKNLKHNTFEYNSLINSSSKNKFFGGYISDNKFKIRRETIVNQIRRPFFKGTITKTSYGSSILLEFYTRLWVELIVILIWLFVFYNGLFIIKTNDISLIAITIPFLIMILVATLRIPSNNKKERKIAIHKLNEIFNESGEFRVKYKTNFKNINASS